MAATTYTLVAGRPTIDKDPDAVLDYSIDWGDWLPVGDSITAASSTATGCVVNSTTVAGSKVVMWISGGTAGVAASAKARITTAQGRTDERTIYLRIKQR